MQLKNATDRIDIPLAKPSAAPLTASAAVALEAKAATTAAKSEYFIVQVLLMEKKR